MNLLAHRYRVGTNVEALPINRPRCPFATYHRNGAMRFDDNGGIGPNYDPNSFGGPTQDKHYVERAYSFTGAMGRYDHRTDDDYYSQAGALFRIMNKAQQQLLIGNIVNSMKSVPKEIQLRQIEHFRKADPAYGSGVAAGLGIELVAQRAA